VLALDLSLWFSEALEHRGEEVSRLKKDLRLKDEVIQQREIEISCLRGQVKNFNIILGATTP
jgi:hypothetical protein